jgi:hypothetical protein
MRSLIYFFTTKSVVLRYALMVKFLFIWLSISDLVNKFYKIYGKMLQNLLYLPKPSCCVERNSCSAAWELQIALLKPLGSFCTLLMRL